MALRSPISVSTLPSASKNAVQVVHSRETIWLANAYISACETLCESMITDCTESDPDKALVLLNLCHHSLELFYKAGLNSQTGTYRKDHKLLQLEIEFIRAFPNCNVKIPEVLREALLVSAPLLPEGSEADFERVVHERFRYHTQRNGRPWPVLDQFDIEDFLSSVIQLKHAFLPFISSIGWPH